MYVLERRRMRVRHGKKNYMCLKAGEGNSEITGRWRRDMILSSWGQLFRAMGSVVNR